MEGTGLVAMVVAGNSKRPLGARACSNPVAAVASTCMQLCFLWRKMLQLPAGPVMDPFCAGCRAV